MKNKYLILENIQEAREQLEEIEKQLQDDSDYDDVELRIELEHAYHHLNFAWNIRNEDDKKIDKFSNEDFQKWSKFPKDDIMEYE